MVHITFTPKAAEQIHKRMAGKEVDLKLFYESEGCAVDGIPILKLVRKEERSHDDVFIETNAMPIILEQSKLIYWDEELEIDFSEQHHAYRLSSPKEIFSGRMSLIG